MADSKEGKTRQDAADAPPAESHESDVAADEAATDQDADEGGPAGTPDPAPGSNGHLSELEKKLAKLMEKTGAQKRDLDSLSRNYKVCLEDYETLRKLIDDIKKILDKYGKSLDTIRAKESDLKKYSDNKTEMILSVIKDRKAEIEQVMQAADKEIQRLTAVLTHHRDVLKRYSGEHDAALIDFEKKEAAFNELKDRQASLNQRLRTMDDLRRQIEEEENGCYYAVMYYLITEFNTTLKGTLKETVDVDALKDQLHATWQALDTAVDKLREKEQLVKNGEKAVAKAIEDLEKGVGEKKDKLLKALRDIMF